MFYRKIIAVLFVYLSFAGKVLPDNHVQQKLDPEQVQMLMQEAQCFVQDLSPGEQQALVKKLQESNLIPENLEKELEGLEVRDRANVIFEALAVIGVFGVGTTILLAVGCCCCCTLTFCCCCCR